MVLWLVKPVFLNKDGIESIVNTALLKEIHHKHHTLTTYYLLLHGRPKSLHLPSSILPNPPPLNIPLHLLASILGTRNRLPPHTPVRHDARPRALRKLLILQIITIFTGASGSYFRRRLAR